VGAVSCPDCGGNCAPECGHHPKGCVYGGFSCGYWLIVEGCKLEHWERHIVVDDETCACGTRFVGSQPHDRCELDVTEDIHV
jgi:hypothetical protein